MNIYEKLIAARNDFAKMGVKKCGKNTYAGYDYFTLEEILPAVNAICAEHKILTKFDIQDTTATLSVIDAEKPADTIVFSTYYARRSTTTKKTQNGNEIVTEESTAADLKGCHVIQQEGATQTYLKRYLYQNAFEISEADALDATLGKDAAENAKKGTQKAPNASGRQHNAQSNEKAAGVPKKAFSDVIAELEKKNSAAVADVLGHYGYENAEEVPQDAQKAVYKDILAAMGGK